VLTEVKGGSAEGVDHRSDKIEENAMDGECSTRETREIHRTEEATWEI
jgi:hypothetical protein